MALAASPIPWQLERHGVEASGSAVSHDVSTKAQGGALKVNFAYVQDGNTLVGPFFTAGFTRVHLFASISVGGGFLLNLAAINPATMAQIVAFVPNGAYAYPSILIDAFNPETSFGLSAPGFPTNGVGTIVGAAFALFLEDVNALSANGTITLWADQRLSPDFA